MDAEYMGKPKPVFTLEETKAFGLTGAELANVEVTSLTVGFADIICEAKMPLPWSIERTLIDDTLNLIYGPPKEMKTFVAIDMAMSHATGLPFLGTYQILKQGLVIYCAGEGIAGIGQRILGWCLERGVDPTSDVPFRRTKGAIQICDGGAMILAAEVQRILDDNPGLTLVGIYIDTLARNFGDGDENATRDMNKFVTQCDTHLKSRFKVPVQIVHHTPLSDSGRPRGSIALMAAVDSMTRVTCKNGYVSYEPDWMKDAEAPPSHILRVSTIPLGFDDQFGEPVKTLVLEMTDKLPNAEVRLSADENAAIKLLPEYQILFEDWRAEWFLAVKNFLAQKGKNKGQKRDNAALRQAWSRVVKKLETEGLITVIRDNDKKAVNVEKTQCDEV